MSSFLSVSSAKLAGKEIIDRSLSCAASMDIVDTRRLMNQISVSRRTTCRLCDSADLRLVVPLAPTPVAEKYLAAGEVDQTQAVYPLDLYMCCACSHVQLLDIVDPKFLFAADYTFLTSNTAGLVRHYEDYVERIHQAFPPPEKALVVDVGSNDGTLLNFFGKKGLRVLGIEPSQGIAKLANSRGIETLPEFLSLDLAQRISRDFGPAAIVTANNVFAHADDLGSMADAIRTMLAPDGVFIFEVSYLLDVIDHMLLGTIFHEHLSYHSVRPMASFLERHGMELIDVRRETIQGGSFVGTAQLTGGPHPMSPSVEELVELELSRRLDSLDTLKDFSSRLEQQRAKVKVLLEDMKSKGMTVAGYGAARSGTTLIAQMDLGKTIDFIVDDNPDKVNRFSPGHHIPILPTRTLSERKPDCVFILAWIHAKRIIENNRDYLARGGRFVVCFPEVRVIEGPQGVL